MLEVAFEFYLSPSVLQTQLAHYSEEFPALTMYRKLPGLSAKT